MLIFMVALSMSFGLVACGNHDSDMERIESISVEETMEKTSMEEGSIEESIEEPVEQSVKAESKKVETNEVELMNNRKIKIQIENTELTATLEDNESVDALLELMKDGPVTIDFSGYGGFEQVGQIGTNLPRNDVQITTSAGDIVLYSGNQMVLFYGSNSWAYTRLGKIDDVSASELESILGNGDISAELSLYE